MRPFREVPQKIQCLTPKEGKFCGDREHGGEGCASRAPKSSFFVRNVFRTQSKVRLKEHGMISHGGRRRGQAVCKRTSLMERPRDFWKRVAHVDQSFFAQEKKKRISKIDFGCHKNNKSSVRKI